MLKIEWVAELELLKVEGLSLELLQVEWFELGFPVFDESGASSDFIDEERFGEADDERLFAGEGWGGLGPLRFRVQELKDVIQTPSDGRMPGK